MKVDIDDALDLTAGAKNKNQAGNLSGRMFLLLLFAILASSYYLYANGYIIDPKTVVGYQQNQQQLIVLGSELVSLKKELLVLSKDKQIQQETNRQLNEKLTISEDDLKSLKEKLLLYENILSASEQKKGIQIRHFGVTPVNRDADSNRDYAFTLILSKSMRGIPEVKGQYLIRFSGKEKGKKATYTYRDLFMGESRPDLNFTLKQYASFEGNIRLPDEFVVNSVDVWVIPRVKGLRTQKKSYVWANLTE